MFYTMYLDGEYQLLLFLPFDMWLYHSSQTLTFATCRRQSLPGVIFDSCTHGKSISFDKRLHLEPEAVLHHGINICN
jgi:hypothetical protein